MSGPSVDLRIINWSDSKAPNFDQWERYPADTVRKIVIGPSPGSDAQPLELDLERLAQFLPRFKNLTHLYLWKIAGLKHLPALPKGLECLDLRDNTDLTAVPAIPETLETLDLGGCTAVTALPEGDHSGLRYLYLDRCAAIAKFAPILAILPNLRDLRLEGCRFEDLQTELCLPGNRAKPMQQWHRSWTDQGRVFCDTLKVLLIGNGRVGKTTLVRRLMGLPADEKQKSTHAIQFQSLEWDDFRPKDATADTRLTVNLWDFGGQDLYHNTHRIFFQGASVFLVLWSVSKPEIPQDEREENVHRPLSYWLDQVLSVNPEARILVVRTRADQDPGIHDWKDQDQVEHRHRGLKQVTAVEAFNGWGEADEATFKQQLRAVREAILEVASEQLGSTEKRAMPGGWVAVANHLVAIQRGNTKRLEAEKRLEDTVWTLERFLMLVNEKCRRGDGTPSEDGNKPEPLLEWLNAAGYLFRDPRRLPDRLIIDQRWAVMAIYTLFWRKDGKKTLLLDKIELNSGRITGAELFEDGWGSQGFTVLERQLFLEYMLSCDLLVEVESGTHREDRSPLYWIPQHLPPAEHRVARLRRRDVLERRGDEVLRFEVEDPLLGNGVMSAVIVHFLRRFGLAADAWRWGVGFEMHEPDGRAMIEWRESDKGGFGGRLSVQVAGAAEGVALIHEAVKKALEEASGGASWMTGIPAPSRSLDDSQIRQRLIEGKRFQIGDKSRPVAGFPDLGEGVGEPRVVLTVGISLAGSRNVQLTQPEEAQLGGQLLGKINHVAGLELAATQLREELDRRGQYWRFKVKVYLERESHGSHDVRALTSELCHCKFGAIFLSAKYLFSEGCMPELVGMFRHHTGGFPQERYRLFRYSSGRLSREEYLQWIQFWMARDASLQAKVEGLSSGGINMVDAYDAVYCDKGLGDFYQKVRGGLLQELQGQLRNYPCYQVGDPSLPTQWDDVPEEPEAVASWVKVACDEIQRRLDQIEERMLEGARLIRLLRGALAREDTAEAVQLYLQIRRRSPSFANEKADVEKMQWIPEPLTVDDFVLERARQLALLARGLPDLADQRRDPE